jgi:hypothetical protein
MPMYQALTIFLAAVVISAVGAAFIESLKSDLLRPNFWLVLLPLAALTSAISILVASTRHAGTGFTTSYGWPKPFYFRYLTEAGEQSSGWQSTYFLGNSLVFAGGLLILWTLWRLIRH